MGFGTDFFGYGKGRLEETIELAAAGVRAGDCSDATGYGVGLFDLAEDLGFADNHGVEGRSDAEEMADSLALAELVEVGADGGGGDGEVLMQEAEEVGAFFLDREDFDPVAGGEDEAFANAGYGGEGEGGVGKAASGDGEALAHVEGRGGVVDTDEDEARILLCALSLVAHGVGNLWTAESWLAAQTQRTTMKTKLER